MTDQNRNLVNNKNIFFELTQESKALRINQELCDFFIDDLPEIFALHNFPKKTKKILFDPDKNHNNFDNGQICSSWGNIQEVISNDFFRE